MSRLFLLFTFLLSLSSYGQLTKDNLPREEIYEKVDRSPSTIQFSKNRMILISDPVLNYGFQYTVFYKMAWVTDTTFNLKVIKSYQKNNNPVGRKRKNRNYGGDFFGHSQIKNWKIEQTEDGHFLFSNDKPTSRQMIFGYK